MNRDSEQLVFFGIIGILIVCLIMVMSGCTHHTEVLEKEQRVGVSKTNDSVLDYNKDMWLKQNVDTIWE